MSLCLRPNFPREALVGHRFVGMRNDHSRTRQKLCLIESLGNFWPKIQVLPGLVTAWWLSYIGKISETNLIETFPRDIQLKPNSVQTIRILRHVTKTVVGILLGLLMMPRGIKKHALAAVQICAGNIGQLLGWFLYSCWEKMNWCVMWKCTCSFEWHLYILSLYIYEYVLYIWYVCFHFFDFSRRFCTWKMWMIRREDYGTCGWTMKCKQFDTKQISQSSSKLLVILSIIGKNVKNTCFIVVF